MDRSAPLTVNLAEIDRRAVALAGGKGANLGELVQAGLPVPEGFVLTTRAYDLAAEAAGVDPARPAEANAEAAFRLDMRRPGRPACGGAVPRVKSPSTSVMIKSPAVIRPHNRRMRPPPPAAGKAATGAGQGYRRRVDRDRRGPRHDAAAQARHDSGFAAEE